MALKKTSDSPALRPVETRDYARDLAGLLAQLRDPDPSIRRWAARDLGTHPSSGPAVSAQLAGEQDPSVRSALFNTAARLGGSEVVAGLLPLLRSEDPGLRNGAIEVLAGLPDAVGPHMAHLLHDADSDVRIFAVNLLGDLKHVGVPGWLAEALLTDDCVNVVGAALDVLAEVGTPESLPAIGAAARRFPDDAYVAFAAELAVERIGGA